MTNKEKLFKVTLLIFIILMTFLIITIIQQLIVLYDDSPTSESCDPGFRTCDNITHHKLIPSSYGVCDHSKKDWTNIKYEINSLGFRDKEYNFTKCQDCYRILIIGDSFTEGKGVNIENTFQNLVEIELNKKHSKPIEVINAGVDSNSIVLEYLRLKNNLLKLSPDLIILNFDIGDVIQDFEYLLYADYSESGEIIGVNGCTRHILNHTIPSYVIFTQPDYDDQEFVSNAWTNTFTYLSKIIELTIEENIRLVITTYPRKFQLIDKSRQLPQKMVLNFCNEKNLSCLDMTSKFKENEFFKYDPHWNKKGHNIASESILNFIDKNNLITESSLDN